MVFKPNPPTPCDSVILSAIGDRASDFDLPRFRDKLALLLGFEAFGRHDILADEPRLSPPTTGPSPIISLHSPLTGSRGLARAGSA
jgi:hypothetical protein